MDQSLVVPWFDKEDNRKYACLMWNITRRCGFGCDYCPFHNDTSPFTSRENVDRILSWIGTNLPSTKNAPWAQITLFGGEPTLHPEFIYIVRHLSLLGFDQIPIYTNFSAPIGLYLDALMSKSIVLILTYHEQHMTAENFIEKLATLIDGTSSLKYLTEHIRINVMTSDVSYQSVHKAATTMGFFVNITEPHRHGQNHDSHAHNATTVVDTSGWNKLMKGNKNHFKGWNCLAGRNNIYIEENGDLFPCQCIGQAAYLKKPEAQPRITNILHDPNFEWKDLPATVCPMKACRFELFLTKYK